MGGGRPSGVSYQSGPSPSYLAPPFWPPGKPMACGDLGDIDGDGRITLADMDLLTKHLRGERLLTPEEFVRGDVNRDGKINILDWSGYRAYLRGDIQRFRGCP